MSRLLLLGGVGDALKLARQLDARHIYSLAGLGRRPDDLRCQLRVGGFGGVDGLAGFIEQERISLLLDATHPYAARISDNAAKAARRCGIPCWALRRPAWQPQPGDDWRPVSDWAALQQALRGFQRPLFTLGREPLQHLAEIPDGQFWTLRLLDAQPVPANARCLADRGPYRLEAERALFAEHGFDVLISKNSGGSATAAKLQVARERGLPVLMLQRPLLTAAERHFDSLEALQQALCPDWLDSP
ncbi:TPA: cobalt-precorrin-6A reductase [Klebsiella pneumoniae]